MIRRQPTKCLPNRIPRRNRRDACMSFCVIGSTHPQVTNLTSSRLRIMTAGVRIKMFANSLPACQISGSENEKALENINVFKGLRWLRGPATTETDIF